MEVKIGVRHVSREITLESSQTADEVAAAVEAALQGSPVLRLTDSKGRLVIVPTEGLAYVEVGIEEAPKVGFGVA